MSRRRKPNNDQRGQTSQSQPAAETTQGDQKRQWYKVDLHLHTPGSNDYEQPEITYLEWLRRAAEQELDIVAITDHNTVAGVAAMRNEVEWLTRLEQEKRLTKDEAKRLEEWRTLSEKVVVLPGFEFTATFGFHILGLFPPETPVRQLELVLLQLNVPPDKLDIGSTETGASTDVLTAYRIISENGGIAIAAHANSTHGVAMRDFPFGGQTKIAYTQDPNLSALEVTDLEKRGRSTARFFSGTKAEYPRKMHCIQGSDAHRLIVDPKKPKRLGIGERASELFLEEPTFSAIQALFASDDFRRTRPARPKDQPFDAVASAREEGPNISQSFHESASQRGGRIAAILSDVCAFANSVGGTIYVGASPRKAKPKGLEDPKAIQNDIQAALSERLAPELEVKYEICESEKAQVLCIHVPKGRERPYCLDEFKFYIRDDTDTSMAVRDEIIALVTEVLESQRAQSGNKQNNRRQNGRSSNQPKRQPKSKSPTNGTANGSASQKTPSAPTSVGSDDAFYLPQVGVEIIESVQRNGNQVHSIRDMRNGHVIKNVTRKGSRKLWAYAIKQHEDSKVDQKKVDWSNNIAMLKADKRAGKTRYDLALKENGSMRIFYGVTEDGMEGPWSRFIQDD